MTSGDRADIVVVGGGISGLTTAFWLRRAGLDVLLLERNEQVGGAIRTVREDGWLFELGPNTVLENNPAVRELVEASELGDERIEAKKEAKRRFLWKGDRLVPLPGGPIGFIGTPLFSVGAKLRLLKEPWIAPPADGREESIADFVRRRLGPEFLAYAVGPFVSGVYAGDPERLSVRWATRKIAALEERHGSLIRGAFARRKGPAPGGAMISFRDGLDRLPRRLAERIGRIETATVDQVLRGDAGPVVVVGDRRIHARRVVLSVPTDVTTKILGDSAPEAAELEEIAYSPVAVMSLGFRRDQIRHPLGGFGFLAPRCESLRLLGCLFTSEIFTGRAPDGHVALSAFIGGRTDPEALALDDSDLESAILGDLGRALGLTGEPVFKRISRWPRAIPQYEVGHDRFRQLASRIENRFPGLFLGGNFRDGVSVPDCIKNGSEVARRIITSWTGSQSPNPPEADPAPLYPVKTGAPR